MSPAQDTSRPTQGATDVGKRVDPPAKRLLRGGYRAATGLRARLFGRRARPGEGPRVFYGGARAGDAGGPLVKVSRLQTRFPEAPGRFNLVYSLSNAPYLGAGALDALCARGVALVHNQNGVFYPGWFAGDWKAQNARMAEAYHRADHVFWQSDFCRCCADEFLGPRDGPGEVLFNAVDTARFSPGAPRLRSGLFTFLLTGKIQGHLAYRLEDSIAGLARARASGTECRLLIAGILDEPATAAARAAATRCGVEAYVFFQGPYTQDTAPELYRSADAYIMTKHADPCPNTVIEAMSCGLPVVYVSSGGVPELVGGEAGAGVPAGDDWERLVRPEPEALGAAMTRVAANRDAMSAAARGRAEAQFGLEAWLDRHDSVFRRLVGERTSGA